MKKQKHFFLLRGLAREAAHWGDFVETLETYFPYAKITCIDLPGAGEFLHIKTPSTIDEMSEFMRQKFLIKSSKDEDRILFAVSLGGMIATNWIKNYPNDFSKAILVNTSFGDISPFYFRLKPTALVKLALIPFLKNRAQEKLILSVVTNNSRKAQLSLSLWERISKDRPMKLINILKQIHAARKFEIKNFIPPIPILILASTHDHLVDPECSRQIGKKWKIPVIEHDSGGHDLTHDDPEWICQKIRDSDL